MDAMSPGRVIWITGLSGAGKTTLAKALIAAVNRPAILLDGDEMREALAGLASGYGYEDRKKLALTYARLCRTIAVQGHLVVCATISMFHEVHAWNRGHLPGYLEIYLDASEETRKRRDYKKIYARTNEKDQGVVGRELKPELPLSPDIVFRQPGPGPEEMAELILQSAEGRGLLARVE
jgi:adenylylsulfate kinase